MQYDAITSKFLKPSKIYKNHQKPLSRQNFAYPVISSRHPPTPRGGMGGKVVSYVSTIFDGLGPMAPPLDEKFITKTFLQI